MRRRGEEEKEKKGQNCSSGICFNIDAIFDFALSLIASILFIPPPPPPPPSPPPPVVGGVVPKVVGILVCRCCCGCDC